MNKSKSERFPFYFEFDDEELQEIMRKMEQSVNTIRDCAFELERLGIAKVQRKEKTANDK